MAHFRVEKEVAIPVGVEVIKVVGSQDGNFLGSKLLIAAHSDVDEATAKGRGDDLGDAIKTAYV